MEFNPSPLMAPPPFLYFLFQKPAVGKLKINKWVVAALLAAGGYYLYSRSKAGGDSASSAGANPIGDAVGAAFGASSGLGGLLNAAAKIPNILTQGIPVLNNATNSAQTVISGVSQNLSSAGAQGLLATSGVPYVAQTLTGGIISISPSANSPPTALNSVAQSIQAASVSTGFGNFQTSGGATQYIPAAVSMNTATLTKAGSYATPGASNTPASVSQASLLATGRIG